MTMHHMSNGHSSICSLAKDSGAQLVAGEEQCVLCTSTIRHLSEYRFEKNLGEAESCTKWLAVLIGITRSLHESGLQPYLTATNGCTLWHPSVMTQALNEFRKSQGLALYHVWSKPGRFQRTRETG